VQDFFDKFKSVCWTRQSVADDFLVNTKLEKVPILSG
jgi:hypothetical protein